MNVPGEAPVLADVQAYAALVGEGLLLHFAIGAIAAGEFIQLLREAQL